MTQTIRKIGHEYQLHMQFFMALTLLAFAALAQAASGNLYADTYRAQSAGLVSSQPSVTPKILRGKDKAADNISMLQEGFDLVGSSGFDAGKVSPDLALEHAKAIQADQVLVYIKPLSEKSAAGRIQQLREAAKKNGGVLSEEDIADDGKQYNYFASYWVKLPPPLLGLHVVKLKVKNTNVDAAKVELVEKGLKVIAVIKGSPADKAKLMRGDLLLNVAGMTMEKPENLSKAALQNQGKTVEIAYVRDGQAMTTSATVNSRNH